MVFDVASHRGLTDERVQRQRVGWLFSQFEMVQRANFAQWTGMVTATEVALSRVLGPLFAKSKKKPPPLPTWEQISQGKGDLKQQLKQKPAWMVRFEKAQKEQEGDDAS